MTKYDAEMIMAQHPDVQMFQQHDEVTTNGHNTRQNGQHTRKSTRLQETTSGSSGKRPPAVQKSPKMSRYNTRGSVAAADDASSCSGSIDDEEERRGRRKSHPACRLNLSAHFEGLAPKRRGRLADEDTVISLLEDEEDVSKLVIILYSIHCQKLLTKSTIS